MGSEIYAHKGKNNNFYAHKAKEGRTRRRREEKNRKGAEKRGEGRGTKGEKKRKESKRETARIHYRMVSRYSGIWGSRIQRSIGYSDILKISIERAWPLRRPKQLALAKS